MLKKYLFHPDDKKILSNQRMIKDSIDKRCAYLLMQKIAEKPRKWLVYNKNDELMPLLLAPGIHECVCSGKEGQFNRYINDRRQKIEEKLAKDLKQHFIKKEKIIYLSLGAAGLFQELMNAYLILSNGINLDMVLVDTVFKDPSAAKINIKLFIDFVTSMAKERSLTVNIQFLESVKDIQSGLQFDIISAVDFEPILYDEMTYHQTSKTYSYLNKDGRFYLSYDIYDFVYDAERCIASNSEKPLLLRKSHPETDMISKMSLTG